MTLSLTLNIFHIFFYFLFTVSLLRFYTFDHIIDQVTERVIDTFDHIGFAVADALTLPVLCM